MSDDVTHNLPNDLLQQILDGVGALGKRLDGMDSRLEALEARSYDTKPLWERAFAGLAEVKQEVAEIKQDLAEVKQEVAEIKREVAEIKQELVEVNRRLDSMERRFSVLNDDVLYMRAEHRKLEDRVERLESPRS